MIDWLNLQLHELSAQDLRWHLLALALAGFFYCFLGYRLLRFILALTGFLLAGVVAGVLAGWLSMGNVAVMAVAAIFGGICGAFALFFLYRAGIFCLAFLGAFLVAHEFTEAVPEQWAPWAVLGAAVLGGLLALLAERPVMKLATAAIGAWLLTYAGAYALLGPESLQDMAGDGEVLRAGWVLLAVWVVLWIGGSAAQFGTKRRKEARAA